MNCSPIRVTGRTRIPAPVRDWLGKFLQGPPRGRRTRHSTACLFALGRIGDFILTLSALRLLMEHFGSENCVLVIPAGSAGIAEREFPAARRIVMPDDASSLFGEIAPIWWRERQRFATDRFTQRICLSHQRSLYYELVLSWIEADEDHRLLPATYPAAPVDGWGTELLGHWRLTEQVLGRTISREEIAPRFSHLTPSNDGRLVVYPFSRDPARSLSPEKLVAVLQCWRERSRAPVVFGGSPADQVTLEHCRTLAQAAGLDSLSIETPRETAGLLDHIARAGAVLATDSAPAHIATALDKYNTVVTTAHYWGYCQPWHRSSRQQVFLQDDPAERIAAALPTL